MSDMGFYGNAMKRAIGYVMAMSTSDHIHSVHWTQHGFDGEERYLDVLIETTDIDGQADEKWEIRVRYDNDGGFYVDRKNDVCFTKL